MPFCPKCKFEYESRVTVCPDCDQPLVAQLPLTGPSGAAIPDDSWVGVCRVMGEITAGLAKGALDTNNIPSMMISSAFHSLGGGSTFRPGLSSKAGGDILMVPREFREDAELVLEAVLGDDFEKYDARQ